MYYIADIARGAGADGRDSGAAGGGSGAASQLAVRAAERERGAALPRRCGVASAAGRDEVPH